MGVPSAHLLCIAGSLRRVSYSLAACRAAQAVAEAEGFSVEVLDPRELNLPMYMPDYELEEYSPGDAGVLQLLAAYRRADAMIWVSPTYHGTVSGVFKNALDFAEFLCRDTPPYLQGRPVGLISINGSTPFAAMADCARELRAWLAPTQIVLSSADFDEDLRIASDRAAGRLSRLIGELGGFVRARKS